jgi:hypothetical protein
MKAGVSGIKTFSFGQDLVFDAYVQFKVSFLIFGMLDLFPGSFFMYPVHYSILWVRCGTVLYGTVHSDQSGVAGKFS